MTRTTALLLAALGAGLLALFAPFWFMQPQDAATLALRAHQLALSVEGLDPQLLYRLNTPYGLIVESPFSTGGAYLLHSLSLLLGGGQEGATRALLVLPHLGSAALGATLGMMALLVVRRNSDLWGITGLVFAILGGGLTAALGLFLGLSTGDTGGLTLLAAALALLPFALLLQPRGFVFLSSLAWFAALWILPAIWPLLALGQTGLLALSNRLPRREHMVFALALLGGGIALTQSLSLTGATDPFDQTALSLFHACLFWAGSLLLLLAGFLPKHVFPFWLGAGALAMLALPLPAPLPLKLAVTALTALSVVFLLLVLRATETRGLRGREWALAWTGIGAALALLWGPTGPALPATDVYGWMVLALGLLASMRVLSWTGLSIANGWAALGVGVAPIAATIVGASIGILQQPEAEATLARTVWPSCPTARLTVHDQAEAGLSRRVLAEDLTGAALLPIPGISLLRLGTDAPDFDAIFQDTTPGFTTAQRLATRRSLDTIVVCGSADTPGLHDSLWAGEVPDWIVEIDRTSNYAVFQILLEPEDAPTETDDATNTTDTPTPTLPEETSQP